MSNDLIKQELFKNIRTLQCIPLQIHNFTVQPYMLSFVSHVYYHKYSPLEKHVMQNTILQQSGTVVN